MKRPRSINYKGKPQPTPVVEKASEYPTPQSIAADWQDDSPLGGGFETARAMNEERRRAARERERNRMRAALEVTAPSQRWRLTYNDREYAYFTLEADARDYFANPDHTSQRGAPAILQEWAGDGAWVNRQVMIPTSDPPPDTDYQKGGTPMSANAWIMTWCALCMFFVACIVLNRYW